jgi:hypothetical protein
MWHLARNLLALVPQTHKDTVAAAMTTDLYSHVMPTALRAAADAMDRLLVQPN